MVEAWIKRAEMRPHKSLLTRILQAFLFSLGLSLVPGLNTLTATASTKFSGIENFAVSKNYLWIPNSDVHDILGLDITSTKVTKEIKTLGEKFNSPTFLTVSGLNIWASDPDEDSVAVFNTYSGHRKWLLSSSRYEFSAPSKIVIANGIVFVLNVGSDTVSEISEHSGKFIRNVNISVGEKSQFGFYGPSNIFVSGEFGWVTFLTPRGDDAVVEFEVKSGSVVRVIRPGEKILRAPSAIIDVAGGLWVTASDTNALVELNPKNGRITRDLTSLSFKFNQPTGIASNGQNLWITNEYGDSVTEVDALNGRLIRVIGNTSQKFEDPGPIAAGGGLVWVFNTGSNTITELDAQDGQLIRILK